MKVYMELSSSIEYSQGKRKHFLYKALDDGKVSIKSYLSPPDVFTVAEVCQRLAKFPKFYLDRPAAVSERSYLNEALDYLNQCISAKGQTYFTAYTIGTIYYDMGEYRTATEWLKREFMLSENKRAFGNVKKLCMSVLRLGEESTINIELIQVLTFIASRINDLKFVHHLVPVGLWKNYLERLWKFL